MNGIRMMMFAGLLAVGGLGLTAPAARGQAPGGAAPASAPRYYYGWGANGWGYYAYPATPTVPAARGGFYSAPAPVRSPARTTRTAPSAYREWPTGRNVLLAKPWLRPLQ